MNKQYDGSLRYNKTLKYHLTNSLAIVTLSWPADIAVTVKSLELRSSVKIQVAVLGRTPPSVWSVWTLKKESLKRKFKISCLWICGRKAALN